MRHDGKDDFQAFLWGQILLFGLLGASLALFLNHQSLQTSWALPELRLVLQTVVAIAAGIVAVLAAVRFSVEGRRLDLLLSTGFVLVAVSTLAFSVAPVLGGQMIHRPESWAGLVGRVMAWVCIAAAPFTRGRTKPQRRAVGVYFAALIALALVWIALRSLGSALPGFDTGTATVTPLLTAALAAHALLNLIAVVGFGLRFRNKAEDLDRWLGLGATLMLFASLYYLLTPVHGSDHVSLGDFLRVLAYGVLLVGAWRAIRFAEFGRAVAEERARVAREIHDGLAQYLFAVATHATMLESDSDDADARLETIANLKKAATAAQQEARFAVLALSSASGNAPFDAALRRYVDFLTADGGLEVELEIDPSVRLAPDEQIEVFRIVQEGLANVRKHADATIAEVTIGHRVDGDRFVAIYDDGRGFDGETTAAGQGLKNMRSRAENIEGGFKLASRPGFGTALEVVLRA